MFKNAADFGIHSFLIRLMRLGVVIALCSEMAWFDDTSYSGRANLRIPDTDSNLQYERNEMINVFQPINSDVLPHYAGVATFMRMPLVENLEGVELGIFGVPWEGGSTDKPGAREGPRAVRIASTRARPCHGVTGLRPFDQMNVADVGDVAVNPVNLPATLSSIEQFVRRLQTKKIVPLAVGGDHLITLPILRALGSGQKLALIHFDAHVDTWKEDFGRETLTHGTPFYRASCEGLIDPTKSIQIGIRELIHSPKDLACSLDLGFTIVNASQAADMGIDRVVEKIVNVVGTASVYLTFDMDVLDPAFAPGTGTPEVGGLATLDILRILRGLQRVKIIGADVVEIAPMYDTSGNTALVAATVLYEIMCLAISASQVHEQK